MRAKNLLYLKKHVIRFIFALALLVVLEGCTNTSKVNELLQGSWTLEYEGATLFSYEPVFGYKMFTFDRNNKFKYYDWNTANGVEASWVGSYEIERDTIYIYDADGLTKMKLTYYFKEDTLYLLTAAGDYLTK